MAGGLNAFVCLNAHKFLMLMNVVCVCVCAQYVSMHQAHSVNFVWLEAVVHRAAMPAGTQMSRRCLLDYATAIAFCVTSLC